jgi:hypothetical protein
MTDIQLFTNSWLLWAGLSILFYMIYNIDFASRAKGMSVSYWYDESITGIAFQFVFKFGGFFMLTWSFIIFVEWFKPIFLVPWI